MCIVLDHLNKNYTSTFGVDAWENVFRLQRLMMRERERTDCVPPLWRPASNWIPSFQHRLHLIYHSWHNLLLLPLPQTLPYLWQISFPFFFRILRDNCCKNFVDCVPIVGTSSKKGRKIKSAFIKWPEAFFCDIRFVMRINELFLWKVLSKHSGKFEIKYAFLIYVYTYIVEITHTFQLFCNFRQTNPLFYPA